jgi:hypothetical protein
VRKAKLPSGEQAAMTGENASFRIDQNRIQKSKFGDAGRDLRNLSIRMRSGIPGPRDQPVERPMLDALRHRMRERAYPSKSDLEDPSEGAP